MRVLCLLLAGLSLHLTGGEPDRTQRSFWLGLRPGSVTQPQPVVILKSRPVHAVTRYAYSPPTLPVYKPVHKPVYKQVYRPVYKQPAYKPVYPAPTQPVYPAPTQQVYPAPTQQVYPAPTQQAYPAPTQQVYPAPTQQVYPVPVQPGPGNSRLLLSWQTPGLAGRKFNWHQADKECRQRGLLLLSVESNAEHLEVIQGLIASTGIVSVWTSGQRDSQGWFWSATGQPFPHPGEGFTNWGNGKDGLAQPDNREGNEVCLAVLNNVFPGDGIKWHDTGCQYARDFVCE